MNNAINLVPTSPALYKQRGILNFYNHNLSAALKDFGEAIRLNRKDIEAAKLFDLTFKKITKK